MENSAKNIINHDLNTEPNETSDQESVIGYGSFLSHIETTNSRIEDRLRQIEAVTARSRRPYSSNAAQIKSDRAESQKIKNRDEISTNLISKALEMDEVRKKGDGEGFFDCNVCLNMANDPILTCCGHLFCWPCFYDLPYVHSDARECPVCSGVVSDTGLTPIYGVDVDFQPPKLKGVPPRPDARRIESWRQKQDDMAVNSNSISVEDAMMILRPRISGLMFAARREESERSESASWIRGNFQESEINTEVSSAPFMTLLSEGAASRTSLSSSLISVQRMVEGLQGIIQSEPSTSRSGTPSSPRR